MKKDKLSISSRNLKYKLKISFMLMSILPLLVSAYLVSNFILPKVGFQLGVVLSLAVSAIIALSGYMIIKELFERILSVSTEAKLMAAGDIGRQMPIENMDELGDLGQALNQMTKRIRGNMDELKGYSEKTTEINFEIQKRVLVLSSLLQVSSLISQGAKLEDIFKISVEKSRLLASSDTSYLLLKAEGEETFFLKAADGINAQFLLGEGAEAEGNFFRKVIYDHRPLVIDKENRLGQGADELFYDKFKIKNTLALPVFLKGKVVGILGIGNNKEAFLYKNDDLELLDVFAKQVAISIENDLLTHRVEKLEIKDALTGLYNESFIHSRLQEEIRRSITYQRPCSFVLLNIDSFRKFQTDFGSLVAEATLKKVAFLIRDSVGEIDRVGRVGDNEFAIVLPEKNKRQGQSVAEDVRHKIAFSFSEDPDQNKRLTVSGGVSENPLDGINAEELMIKAKSSLNLAKIQGKNRILG